ncbi:protein pbn1 [Eremomyces bilateralis CBS 781.70]|uniref:Protein PBN1 n=1 Tax=Eremomyces bilateralis CBS 781.70 TaxID=1392243 RepID=A0A6G1G5Y8_9PEZI|nr:protein pbn1 [Eremomyces bilateralis CBS 781.70]KAF1813483.1 protein pbn1 [Eremomyces bilateralis CBS 781.70]
MRSRITYLQHDVSQFNPSQIRVRKDSIELSKLDAAKEHRMTFAFSELPRELWLALKQCHELHVRWVSMTPVQGVGPYVSRMSPGLHVFFSPLSEGTADRLCPLIKKVFGDGMDCVSPQESFISPPILSERFSASSSLQYYHVTPSLKDLVAYLKEKICPRSDEKCIRDAASLLDAKYLDMDYDAISHSLTVTAFWDRACPNSPWTETHLRRESSETIEIGVLNAEKASEPEEQSLGGFLAVLGQDDEPKPTLFSFPSRHHALPSSPIKYRAHFSQPTGLHPTLHLTFSSPPVPPSPITSPDAEPMSHSCALHAYLTLPSQIFLDRYQLSDPLFLSSRNLRSLRSLSGETDLEAPDWVVSRWGSAALIELASPADSRLDHGENKHRQNEWTASIPLHLRYLSPRNVSAASNGGRGSVGEWLAGWKNGANANNTVTTPFPWPPVFWACAADSGDKFAVNPFDRTNLGYDGLFGRQTVFYHIEPEALDGGSFMGLVNIPVMDTEWARWVELGTVWAIALGTVWVCWVIGKVVFQNRNRKQMKGDKKHR